MTARERRQSIDLMRFVAAFGIVWAHMQAPGMIEGYVALGLFVVLTGFLSLRSLARGGARRFWLGRLLRFALPWVVWVALYRLLDVVRAQDVTLLWTVTDPWWLLIGPAVHLWFLPFVVVFSPVVIVGLAAVRSARGVWLAAAACLPLALGAVWLHDAGTLPQPLVQWAFALTPLLYGILSALGHHYRAVAAPLVFVAAAGGIAGLGWGSVAAPFMLAAALLFEAFWRADLRWPAATALGRLAFGIYLIHPAAMLVWFKLGGAALPAQAGAVAVFALSALATVVMRQVPVGRWLT